MIRPRLKGILGVAIMVLTLAFLIYYWRTHPEIVGQLRTINPWATVAIIGLYALMSLVLVGIYDTILRLCSKPIPLAEHTLLTLYSSIVNFFGPLQSGPGFRTLYLKQRHGVSMKAYLTGTLLYYLLFGICNLLFLAAGLLGLLYLPLLLAGATAGLLALRPLTVRMPRLQRFHDAAHSPLVIRLAALTFLQALIAVIIYAVELQAIGQHASLQQVIAYAGAGSLALFVSLTPAAIGFRESFQYLSQSVHHIDNSAIIVANLLDRSVYVVFLGLTFILILGLHARKKLRVTE